MILNMKMLSLPKDFLKFDHQVAYARIVPGKPVGAHVPVKTRLCRYMDKCFNGSRCTFAHSEAELGEERSMEAVPLQIPAVKVPVQPTGPPTEKAYEEQQQQQQQRAAAAARWYYL